MFNDSTAVERVRRGGTHSLGTAKLVNMDVWYATTLWLALLSGWIDPSSGRRTRKNPTGGILMKPIMPPALLTPQTLEDSYYYDQAGPPLPHPAIPSTYPIHSQGFDSSPQRSRLWRSIDDPNMQTGQAKEPNRQFPSPFGPPPKSAQMRNPNNQPSQRFPQNSPFHPGIRGMGPQNKPPVSRMDQMDRDDEGPFGKGNNSPFDNRNPFNRGNPQFNQDNPFSKENPFNERDSMSDSAFGPALEWSGRQRRQPPRLPSPPSMEGSWNPLIRYGSMGRNSPPALGRLEDRQAQNINPFDNSESSSEEQVNMLPRQRQGFQAAPHRNMIRPQGMNYPNPRFQQRPIIQMPQYGLENQDYFEGRHASKVVNRPLKPRNGNNIPSRSRVEEFSGDENSGKQATVEKQIKSEKLVQQPDDEFVVESEERSNVTTGKPSEQIVKEGKSSEGGSNESVKNEEDSRSASEEVTTKKAQVHKSKGQHEHEHEHKHKEIVAVQTEAEENVSRHVHGRSHHSSGRSSSKVAKSNESLEDDSGHGQPKKRRPRTTLATDFNVEDDKKEMVGDTVAVEPRKN